MRRLTHRNRCCAAGYELPDGAAEEGELGLGELIFGEGAVGPEIGECA